MNILILFSSADVGGAEVSLSRLAAQTSDDNYRVATIKGEGKWSNFARNLNLEPIILGNNYSRIFSILLFWMPYLKLTQQLKENPIDIIYVCGIKTTFWLRLFKVFMPKFKIVQGVRSTPKSLDLENKSLKHRNLKNKVFRFIERHFNKKIEYYIANSRAATKVLIDQCQIPQNKIEVIHNGIEARDKYPIIPFLDKKDTVCTVANFSPGKGHVEFLKVIQTVLKTMPHTKFYFAGRDNMNGHIQAEIARYNLSDNVIIKGYIEDVPAFVQNMKVFTLPSFTEGCPTSILEAMSVGTPSIGYDIDGIPELIENDKQGYIIPSYDHDVFAKSIITLLQNREKYEKFQSAGIERIQLEFTLKKMTVRHHEVWEKIMGNENL